MPRRRTDIDRDLQALYDRIPQVECQGKCAESCGPISMSLREHSRIRQAGVTIPRPAPADHTNPPTCPALSDEGTCTVYTLRPLICRLWGAVEDLPCPHGCQPAGGQPLLPSEEAYKLIAASLETGGDPGHLKGATRQQMETLLDAHPELLPILRSGLNRNEAENRVRTFARSRPRRP